jgi:hypothetical protein
MHVAAQEIRRFYSEIEDRKACESAADDGRRFWAEWGKVYEPLGWAITDIFGSYRDGTGLIARLRGRRVLAMTRDSAAIRSTSGKVTIYRRP